MSYSEFQIRLFAWKRLEERAWEKVRFMAWYSMTGSHLNPKKFPKTLNQFLSLDLDKKHKSPITEEQKQYFIEAFKEYLKHKK